MAFLNRLSEFPPKEWNYWYTKYAEWGAWYSGDPENLLNFYTVLAAGSESAQEKFWARIETEERAGIVHLPISGDISATSANLLFSEAPRYKFDEKNKSGERINDFLNINGFDSILLESSELAAALSGCILKIDIEKQLEKIPLVSVISPTQFFPVFWRGRLWEVLFFRIVKETAGIVYRLFENRRREGDSLIIEYRLNKGTTNKVGEEISFDMLDETSNLNLEPIRYNNIDGLGCVYVPNMRPNKLRPGSFLGINDYSSSITMLDSLDFAWTSWMRDIELGMGQIMVDESLLTKDNTNTSGTLNYLNKFSKFKKAFIKLDLTSWKMSGDTSAKPVDSMQFDIRVDEHAKTCESLTYQIVNQCGYSPQTFGLGDFGTAQSGTALRIRENKSQLTRMKKSRYWQLAIRELLIQMQKLDLQSGLSNYEIQDNISIEIEDSILTDTKELSETIRNLYQAQAISNYTKIKLLHPDWDNEKIEEEVNKINQEQGITGEIIPENV